MLLHGPSLPSPLPLSASPRRGMGRTGRGYEKIFPERQVSWALLQCFSSSGQRRPPDIRLCHWEKIATTTQGMVAGPRSWEGELILYLWRHISTHLSSDQTGNCQSPSEMRAVHACPSALSKAMASLVLVSLHPNDIYVPRA